MAIYGNDIRLTDAIARYVNRQLLEKDTVKTALKSTAHLNMLEKTAQIKSGRDFEFKVQRALSTTVKTFIPGDTSSDYVGVSGNPASVNTETYTHKDPVRNGRVLFSFAFDEIRINSIHLEMIESPGKFMEFMDEELSYIEDGLRQFVQNQILNGNGDGYGANSEFYGLNRQVRRYSPTPGGNVANNPANTHFGLLRHQLPALVGNVFDARQVDPGDQSTWVIQAGATLTNGSTTIAGLPSANYSTLNGTGVVGYEVYIYNNGGYALGQSPIRGGVGWYVADVSTSSATTVQMTLQSDLPTGLYDVVLRPFFNAPLEGAAGAWHINKLHKAYLAACDGDEMPDYGRCSPRFFYGFMTHLQGLQRWWTGKDADLSAQGYDNFMFMRARIVPSRFEPDDTLTFCNSSYERMYWQKNYSKFQLRKGQLRPIYDGRQIESLVGHVVIGGQPVNRAPNRSAVITGVNF